MPTVQMYGPRKVSTAPLPGVRKTAAETPLSTGAGLEEAKAQTASAMGGLGAGVASIGAKMFVEERQKADDTALLAADNQLARWEDDRLYNPESGAMTLQGKAAVGLSATVDQEFTKLTGTIEQSLNPRQREAFQRIKAQRGEAIYGILRRHEAGEMQQYEASELHDGVTNGINAAIANAPDLQRVGVELAKVTDNIKLHGPRVGMSPEAVTAQVGSAQTAIHKGVIDSLLTAGQDRKAAFYYHGDADTPGMKTQIDGSARAGIEKALDVGSTLGEAQRQSDTIIKAGGTLTEQREKARAIDDPKLRDEVMQRIEHESDVNARAEREQTEQQSTQGYDILDRTHSVASIPAPLWASYSGGTRSAMRSYAESLAKGEPVETDPVTYYALMTQAGSDPAAFVKQNLLNYKSKLAPATWKEVVDLQRSFRTNDLKRADEQLAGFRTKDQILTDSLYQYTQTQEKDYTPEQRNAKANIGQLIERHVAALETGGKKASNEEIQTIIYGILNQQRTTPGSFWAGLSGFGNFSDTTTKLLDIPTLDRQQIEASIRRQHPGRPITDDDVLAVYVKTHK